MKSVHDNDYHHLETKSKMNVNNLKKLINNVSLVLFGYTTAPKSLLYTRFFIVVLCDQNIEPGRSMSPEQREKW